MKKNGRLQYEIGLLLSQNIDSIKKETGKMSESFSKLHMDKRWNFLWHNNNNNLKPPFL